MMKAAIQYKKFVHLKTLERNQMAFIRHLCLVIQWLYLVTTIEIVFTANSFTPRNLAANSFKSLTSSTSLNEVLSIGRGGAGSTSPVLLSMKSRTDSLSCTHERAIIRS